MRYIVCCDFIRNFNNNLYQMSCKCSNRYLLCKYCYNDVEDCNVVQNNFYYVYSDKNKNTSPMFHCEYFDILRIL